MNPFVFADSNVVNNKSELPLYKELAYDIAQNKIVRDECGREKFVSGNEALRIWIWKTLKTERYRYIVYDADYGIELEQFIGQSNNSKNAAIIKAYVIQALMVNPYIKSIDKIAIDFADDGLKYRLYITTIYGKLYVEEW